MSRRSVVAAVVALAVLLGAELLVRVRADALPEPRQWSTPELDNKVAQIDALSRRGGASVVFLGSSTVDIAVDPALLERDPGARPAYNAAIGAASMEMIATWARRIVVPRLRPDEVVLGLVSREVNPNDLNQREVNERFVESRALRALRGQVSLLDRAERGAERWSQLFRFRSVLRQPSRLFGDSRTGEFGEVINDDGHLDIYRNATYKFTRVIEAVLRGRGARAFEVGDHELRVLHRLLVYLVERDIEVTLVNMPVTSDFVDAHPRGTEDYDDYVAAIRREADAADVPFVDLGVWETELFADPGHTNGRGTRRVTELIGAELRTGSR